jgi:glutaminyl-tRNA synthetase
MPTLPPVPDATTPAPERTSTDFIKEAIKADIASGRFGGRVQTRFPPEPNGYLHIGHTKAMCIDFGMAQEFGGLCRLRFDDTNPVKEDEEFVEAIQNDIRWMGFHWEGPVLFASDYYERLYGYAVQFIEKGKAYVDDLSPEDVRAYRGTITEPGRDSPFRNRSVAENLDLFRRMREGEFAEGSRTLRAKIDMASPNLLLRDPVLYRIVKTPHHRTGTTWSIYPMYDWAQGFSDAIEGVTHSLCSLEYEVHRPLYDWLLDELGGYHPRQIEFARFNMTYTIMSKRYLRRLVEEGYVSGWDDPRMPTLCGLRRRGYTPEAIRAFIAAIGVAKAANMVDVGLLEYHLREDLNRRTPRVMAVLRPLKVVIDNYPEGLVEEMSAVNNPEDPSAGARQVPFSKVLYIERDDFREDPPKEFFRLAPGREVRLRYAYFIRCVGVVKDPQTGAVTELHCTYDPATRGGDAPDGRKVKATLHWVSAAHALPATVRLYDRLFKVENPSEVAEGHDFIEHLNPDALETVTGCQVEPSLAHTVPGDRYQFERLGYFCTDLDSTPGQLILNRTVGLRDTWARIEQKQGKK